MITEKKSRDQEAIKFFNLLKSLVELDTNKLDQNEATIRSVCANKLLLVVLFIISIEFEYKVNFSPNTIPAGFC